MAETLGFPCVYDDCGSRLFSVYMDRFQQNTPERHQKLTEDIGPPGFWQGNTFDDPDRLFRLGQLVLGDLIKSESVPEYVRVIHTFGTDGYSRPLVEVLVKIENLTKGQP